MGMVSWTEDQQKVIDLRDRNILVSAAAGSGKTAVLVERIISMITREDSNINIDNLLIVTFTKAAAGEMRERIGAAIEKQVLEHPENVHLQKQMTLIHNAQITTIDSFCLYVIRNYFHLIDLDPAFRIGDEAELTLLKSDIIAEILEEQYEEGSEEFLEFVESYAGSKNDSVLEDFVLGLYEFSMSYPWPVEWLTSMRKSFEIDSLEELNDTLWMQKMLSFIEFILEDARKLNQLALSVCKEPDGPLAYQEALLSDQELLDRFRGAKQYLDYAEDLSNIKYARLSTKKQEGVSEDKKEMVKMLRSKMKDLITGIGKDFYFQDPEEMLLDMQKVKTSMNKLIDLTLMFEERFLRKKQEKNLLDFHDLEHYALKILVEKVDGLVIPTQAACDLSEQFYEIMIDEYQDSNLVQETILNSISRERLGQPNVFMVGDVKQSIYKFRLARPELFMEKFDTYSTTEGKHQRIDLHKNFRSRGIVLESVNRICKKIMTKPLGGVAYDDDAALYPGAAYPGQKELETVAKSRSDVFDALELQNMFQTEFLVVDVNSSAENEKDKSSGEVNSNGEANSDVKSNRETTSEVNSNKEALSEVNNQEEEDFNYNNRELEARAIAHRIKNLIDPNHGMLVNEKGKVRTAKYSDIVILLRTMSGWADVFTEILTNEGIPAYSDTQSGYFQTIEIKTMLNMLRVLDNPRQDIPFTSVLHSPIVGLKSEELALLRLEKIEDEQRLPLYDCARIYAEKGKEVELKERLEKFLTIFDELRDLVAFTPIHQLILEIYRKTGYYIICYAMPSGEQRKGNLDMLVQKAISFESTSYHGLFQFIRYIEKLLKFEIDYGESSVSGASDNCVRIMSIHKSKGLEFPIVILAGMGKQFNNQDSRARLVLHADYGIGPDCIDYKLRTKSPTLLKKAIQRSSVLDNLGEELRILYVALTRAKEKLIMVGTIGDAKKAEDDWRSEALLMKDTLSYGTLASAKNYFDFVGPVLLSESDVHYEVILGKALSFLEEQKQIKYEIRKEYITEIENSPIQSDTIKAKLLNELHFLYPYEFEANLPIKTTVSELKKLSLKEEEFPQTTVFPKEEDTEKINMVPKFMKNQEDSSHGAGLGTLYHKALEHISFEHILSMEDIHKELRKLSEEGMISAEELMFLDAEKLFLFLTSNIANRMSEAEKKGKLKKEQQFVIGISSKEIYESRKEIDIDDEIGIVNYKDNHIEINTMNDKGKNTERDIGKGTDRDIDKDIEKYKEETNQDKEKSPEYVLIQGIIDAYFEEEGEFVLVDYKTDQVSSKNGEEILRKRYQKQLEYYERALTQITGKKVKEKIIYSFALSRAIVLL